MDGFLMENHIKMDDFGVPLFLEIPKARLHAELVQQFLFKKAKQHPVRETKKGKMRRCLGSLPPCFTWPMV